MLSRKFQKLKMPRIFAVLSLVIAGFTGAGLLVTTGAGAAQAHEFWIDPVDFTPAKGAPIVAHIRTGEMLKGDASPYIRSMFESFMILDQSATDDIPGELGDRPALNVEPHRDGLHIAVYQSRPATLGYKKHEKFVRFITKEGMDWVLDAHTERGLPKTNFSEAYTRFAKSLIGTGDAKGKDREVGLRTELIALTNPYTSDAPVEVQVMHEQQPLADVQIAVFRRDEAGEVTRETLRSDAQGRAVIPRKDAAVTLLSAVHMVEPKEDLAERRGVVWHSLWASLTYGAPLP